MEQSIVKSANYKIIVQTADNNTRVFFAENIGEISIEDAPMSRITIMASENSLKSAKRYQEKVIRKSKKKFSILNKLAR